MNDKILLEYCDHMHPQVLYAGGVYKICSKCGKYLWNVDLARQANIITFIQRHIIGNAKEINNYSIVLNPCFCMGLNDLKNSEVIDTIYSCNYEGCKFSTEEDETLLEHINKHITEMYL